MFKYPIVVTIDTNIFDSTKRVSELSNGALPPSLALSAAPAIPL